MAQLSDSQLQELAGDPRFTKEDYALLSPQDQARFGDIYRQVKTGRVPSGPPMAGANDQPGRWQRGAEALTNFATGAAQGAGETAVTLGRGMSKMSPVANALGNVLGGGAARALYGKESVTPPVSDTQAFDEAQTHLQPRGGMQKAGKIAEQIGEYLIPGAAVDRTIETGAVKAGLALNSRKLIFGARTIGDMAKNAVGAAAVSGLHGEAQPEHEAIAGAGVPLTAAAINMIVPVIERLVPFAVGGAVGKAAGGWGGMVGGLGIASVARNAARLSPEHRQILQDFIKTYGPKTLQAVVGAYGEYRISNQQKMGKVESDLRTFTDRP